MLLLERWALIGILAHSVMAESANAPVFEGGTDTERTVTDRSLRHVEEDVLISKMIRKKAHEVCFEPYVRGGGHVRAHVNQCCAS